MPRSLILYGSFARGEGSIVPTPSGPRFLSDIELGCVTADPRAVIRMATARSVIERATPVDVTLAWLLPSRLTQLGCSNWEITHGRLSLEQYDLLMGSRLLAGRPSPRVPDDLLTPRGIQQWDGLRLMLNRVAETVSYICSPTHTISTTQSKLAKLMTACADALLLMNGEYHHLARRRLESLVAGRLHSLLQPEAQELLEGAYRWRLSPSDSHLLSCQLDEIVATVLQPSLAIVLKTISRQSHVESGQLSEAYLSMDCLDSLCRVYPGHPLAQSAVIAAKSRRRCHSGGTPLWRQVHIAYAGAMDWLLQNASQVRISYAGLEEHVSGLAPDARQHGYVLADRCITLARCV